MSAASGLPMLRHIPSADQPGTFSFNEQLVMSQGVATSKSVESIVLNALPGALQIFPAHKMNDLTGVDWWVEMSSGAMLTVDCKIREKDFFSTKGIDDLALEVWSKKEQRVVGWTLRSDKKTDRVLWYWKSSGRWVMLPFQELCHVFLRKKDDWCRRYQTAIQRTNNDSGHVLWSSECVFVPRCKVVGAINYVFGGDRHATKQPGEAA